VIPFFVVAGLMLAVALAFVLLPLLRSTRLEDVSDVASNVAIFRARKREIEQEFERGAISVQERDSALADLSVRVVDEIPEQGAPVASATQGKRPVAWALGLGAFVCVAATAGYFVLGNWQALRMVDLVAASPSAAHADAPSDQQVLAMVDSLAKKMEQNPSDPKGWILLARSQNALGRVPEALKAFERAIALSPKDAQLLADYADVLVMSQQGRFDGKPTDVIKQALKLDPENLKALALAGTAELRAGNRAASLKHWERMRSLLAPDTDDYRQVESIIADVSGKPVAKAPVNAPTAANAQADASSGAGARITGQVLIDPALTAKVAPGDTLYVFARAAKGPRMPLAVMKINVPQKWPQMFELTDAMAMTPAMKLSAFTEVIVEGRISKSGNAQAQAGDLMGESVVLKPGADNVLLIISRVVP
jgi:cytochrome c-type biogenesis protein CcmH